MKQEIMWCVVNRDGEYNANSLAKTEQESKDRACNLKLPAICGVVWGELASYGYTCQQVKVTIETIKP